MAVSAARSAIISPARMTMTASSVGLSWRVGRGSTLAGISRSWILTMADQGPSPQNRLGQLAPNVLACKS